MRRAPDVPVSLLEYQQEVGRLLREARGARNWALQDVERLSSGAIRASILGAYERGERATTIYRLNRLAEFYGVHITELIPHDGLNAAELKHELLVLQLALDRLTIKIMDSLDDG